MIKYFILRSSDVILGTFPTYQEALEGAQSIIADDELKEVEISKVEETYISMIKKSKEGKL